MLKAAFEMIAAELNAPIPPTPHNIMSIFIFVSFL
jgi:hypothetical protein